MLFANTGRVSTAEPGELVDVEQHPLLALAAGLFTAFAASQLRPVFHSIGDLRNKIELPLLGVVSQVTGESDIRREKVDLLRFLISSGSLVGVFAVILIAMAVFAARRG